MCAMHAFVVRLRLTRACCPMPTPLFLHVCLSRACRAHQRCCHQAQWGNFPSLSLGGERGLRCYTTGGEQVSAQGWGGAVWSAAMVCDALTETPTMHGSWVCVYAVLASRATCTLALPVGWHLAKQTCILRPCVLLLCLFQVLECESVSHLTATSTLCFTSGKHCWQFVVAVPCDLVWLGLSDGTLSQDVWGGKQPGGWFYGSNDVSGCRPACVMQARCRIRPSF